MDISHQYQKLKGRAQSTLKKAFHHQIKLSVTGFSGAGKSSFITSFLYQLLYCNKHHNLPFFKVSDAGRIAAVKMDLSENLTIQAFPYEAAMSSLSLGNWPSSTDNVSTIRLTIKYQIGNPVLSKVKSHALLNIDIVDYPGEWLLDLLMLEQNYTQWSEHALELLRGEQQSDALTHWLDELNQWVCNQDTDNQEAGQSPKTIADSYKVLIKAFKQDDCLVSPGRFLIPGLLENTPVLEFFPLPENILNSSDNKIVELKTLLESRFEHYKEQVVKPFFEQYFSEVDRQIILVDCVNLIRKQTVKKHNLSNIYNRLLPIFNYGKSRFLSRLFSPKIDRVLFAATKSDQIPVDQQFRLQTYLKSLFYRADADIQFSSSEVEYLTLSAIKATQPVIAEIDGESLNCVKGMVAEESEPLIIYPGLFPESIEDDFEHRSQFDLPNYLPPKLTKEQIPHIRMDKAFEYLLGDLFL